jgi:hypothetical protein
LLLQALEQEFVALIGTLDGDAAELFLKLRGAAGVVQMAVGEPDALDGDSGLGDGGEDTIDVAAGIDDDRLLAGVVPQDRAVLLEWCHWYHGTSECTHLS